MVISGYYALPRLPHDAMWDHGRREREAGKWLVSGRQVAGERMMSERERRMCVAGKWLVS